VKILVFLNKNLFYTNGAYSNRMRSLFEGLAKKNIEIHIVINHGIFDQEEFFFHNKFNYPKNIIIHYLGFPFLIRILKRLGGQEIIKQLLLRKQKNLQKGIDFNYAWVNIGLKQETYISSIKLFQEKGTKIVHEINEHPALFLFGEEYKTYMNVVCPEMDVIFLMTKDLIELYKDTCEQEKLFHLPMTVDFDRFKLDRDHNDHNRQIITYVGTMNNKKDGVDILIKAFAIVQKEFPAAKLQLIGPKIPKTDYLEQIEYIKKNNLEDKIEYLGEISRDNIPNLLINSDCLVLARPDSKQAQYGFPTKLGEYLATGNPVVVTSTGEITNYLNNNYDAFIAKPGNIDDFSDKVLNVLRDKKVSQAIGKRGKKTAMQYFNSESQANTIYEILKNNL